MRLTKNGWPFVFTFFLVSGFKCGGSGSSGVMSSEKKEAGIVQAKTVVTPAGDSPMEGLLRLRTESSGIGLVDSLTENSLTLRRWDPEHEGSPGPVENASVSELNARDSLGNYEEAPVLYLEVSSVSCPAGDDPVEPCNLIALKISDEFSEKIRKDGSFRIKLGRMLGKKFTADKNNPTIKLEDVK